MIPHLRIVVAFCVMAVAGFCVMTWWVLVYGDPAMKGDIIGTWKNFAVMAFGIWLARQAGKGQEEIDLDVKRADNTGKLADLAKDALNTPGTPPKEADVMLAPGETAQAEGEKP